MIGSLETWMKLAFMVVCIVAFVWTMLGERMGEIASSVAKLIGGG